MRTSNRTRTMIGGAFATAALLGSFLAPATAQAKSQGYIQDVFPVGLVYGTFEEDPNLTLLVGGTVEEFCPSDPGTAPMRVFVRKNGTVDLKVNDKDQPIYLYELTTESLPIVLDDTTYQTEYIRDGVAFGGADGLQLVALRPGLMVMDSVSDGGDLRARVSVFEAEQTAVADVIDAAVEDGHLQVSAAQFTGADRSLRRQDLTLTGEGVADLECIAQGGCLSLLDGIDEFDPSIWARSENFLVELSSGEPSVFVLVQTKAFGDPLLSQAFEIIDSLRLD